MTDRLVEGAISVTESDRNKQLLQSWVEPEVHVLAIEETAVYPGVGGDASIFPDCTQS